MARRRAGRPPPRAAGPGLDKLRARRGGGSRGRRPGRPRPPRAYRRRRRDAVRPEGVRSGAGGEVVPSEVVQVASEASGRRGRRQVETGILGGPLECSRVPLESTLPMTSVRTDRELALEAEGIDPSRGEFEHRVPRPAPPRARLRPGGNRAVFVGSPSPAARNVNAARPRRSSEPSERGAGSSIRTPSTNVPFSLPRSSTTARPPSTRTRACRRETEASAKAAAGSESRPSRVEPGGRATRWLPRTRLYRGAGGSASRAGSGRSSRASPTKA